MFGDQDLRRRRGKANFSFVVQAAGGRHAFDGGAATVDLVSITAPRRAVLPGEEEA